MTEQNLGTTEQDLSTSLKPIKSKQSVTHYGKLSQTDKEIVISLAVANYSITEICQYLRRSRSFISRVISREKDAIQRRKMDEILIPLEKTAIEKALVDKDAGLLKFLLSKLRASVYGDRSEIKVTPGNPAKITIRSMDGKLLDTLDKPDKDESNV